MEFVQGLRGLAVLLVVGYHYQHFLTGPEYLSLGPRLFDPGAIGVDLFFVLSGFIMVYTTRAGVGGSLDPIGFVIRRLSRIVPPYFIWTLAMWAATRQLKNPAFDTNGEEWLYTLSFQPVQPQSDAPFFGYPLLYVGWSLTFELYFYLLFFFSMLWARARWVVLYGVGIAGLVLVPLLIKGSLSLDALNHYRLPGYLNIISSPLIWEFLAGAVIAHLYLSRFQLRDHGLAATFASLAVGLVVWQYAADFRHGHGLTRWGGPVIILVLALALYTKTHTLRVPGWLSWLGNVSYSMYLVHVIPTMIARHWTGPMTTGLDFVLVCLTLSLVAAYWSHRLLENELCSRLRNYAIRLLGRGHRVTDATS
ncbi:MAG: acyltransferase [Kofleriaceae bacterium]|nr:acyltransferase [Kofleriaceae bacterium]